MLNKALSDTVKRHKIRSIPKSEKLGKCLICGKRVRTSQSYITTSEGYTHKACLKEWRND